MIYYESVISKGRLPLDRAARLCQAIGAEICARDTERDVWEVGEPAAEAWGIAPGPIGARALGRRLVRTAGLEPKPDALEDVMPEQAPAPDHRLARLLTWIEEWWVGCGNRRSETASEDCASDAQLCGHFQPRLGRPLGTWRAPSSTSRPSCVGRLGGIQQRLVVTHVQNYCRVHVQI